MNDSDSIYKTNLVKLVKLCEDRNITLILMKIQTVPTQSKEVINNYVELSGLRYIDFYTAVNANQNRQWYDNYLVPSLNSILITFIAGFIFKEGLSIVENLVGLDVWIPDSIKKTLQVETDKVNNLNK